MLRFNYITECIEKDLEYLEEALTAIADSKNDVLKEILNYIFETKGKRIRPVLVYLTCRLFDKPGKSTHNAAIVLELLHTATLLHDDVVDKALLRRGKQTVNHKWDDKTAVLAGDYLFARAMKMATDYNEYELFNIITPVIINLSVGELEQMDNSKKFEVNAEKYYEIIKNKTASLISVCCKSGAISAGASKENVEIVEQFGDILGIMFQIKDDILDYIGNGETGKEVGVDIREGKITLPFILAWQNMNNLERKEIEEFWNRAGNDRDCEKKIISMIVKNGGILGSEKTLAQMKDDALQILSKLPKSQARQALRDLAEYLISRKL